MNVGEKLAQLVSQIGVKFVFGVPGGQTLPLYEGIRKLDGDVQHILMRDERSAGFAADAHARLSGCIGVCDATVGPGATNLPSPLAEAFCSSIPLLAIISDVPRHWEHRRIRGNASQAMDQLAMFGPVSKWQVALSEPGSLEDVFDQAVRVAVSGRPGPVVLAVPDDVAGMPVPPSERARQRQDGGYPRYRTAPDPEQVARAVAALRKARKPILLIGGGAHASGAGSEVAALAECLHAPVVTSISGKGIVAEITPPAFGVTGSMASPAANEMVTRADLVFFIGCKAGQLATYGYDRPASDTAVIHLDIDPEEIGRNFPQTIGMVADARLGLRAVIDAFGSQDIQSSWDLQAAETSLKQWYDRATGISQPLNAPLKPQAVMRVMDGLLTGDDIVVCDASLASGWAAVYLRSKKAGRGYLAPRGLAGLGWGAPAAIGAALARPGRRILHFAGDGGFAYSVQELEVMARLNLPVVTILFNNDCLGWIKHIQKTRYQERYISCDFNHIDFATVARGFDIRSYQADTLEQLADAMAAEQTPDGPALIDMRTDAWETPVLRNASGGTTAS